VCGAAPALAGVLLVFLAATGARAEPDPAAGQLGSVWSLGTLETGRTYGTSIAAFNRTCSGTHDFAIEVQGEAKRYLAVIGEPEVRGVARGQSKEAPALIDLRGVPPGIYWEGTVLVRCLTCPASCAQDYRILHTRLIVAGPGTAAGAENLVPGSGGPVSARPECPNPCGELYRRALGAEQEAARADARARRAEEDQPRLDADADGLDAEAGKDRADAEEQDRAAEEYRRLAASAEARAQRSRTMADGLDAGDPLRSGWQRAADQDEADARRLRDEAERSEAEARRLEELADGKQRRADELRDQSRRAREEADAAERAAAEAWKLYWECIQRWEWECLQRASSATGGTRTRTPPPGAAPGGASGGGAQAAGSAGGGGSTRPGGGGGGGTGAPPGGGTGGGTQPPGKPPGTADPPREAKVCKWYTFELDRVLIDKRIPVVRSQAFDDPTILEIRPIESANTRSRATGFEYHCTRPGTAVITYRVVVGSNTVEPHHVRIVCLP
jgi:hypothetical protein